MLKRLVCELIGHAPRLFRAYGTGARNGMTITYEFRCDRCGAVHDMTVAHDEYGEVDETGTWFEEARK